MKFLVIIIVMNLVVGCNRKFCSVEVKNNVEVFQKKLNLITGYENGKTTVIVDEYRDALFFMSFVTGIDAKAGYSSTIGYRNKEDYKTNMHDWKKWYSENKCTLTDYYIDSVYKKVGLKYNKH